MTRWVQPSSLDAPPPDAWRRDRGCSARPAELAAAVHSELASQRQLGGTR